MWPTMLKGLHPWRIPLQTVGPVALRVLGSTSFGSVCAVFRHTFYVQATTGVFCIGTSNLYDGPLNVITAAPVTTDWWASGVRLGQTARLGPRNLAVGSNLIFPLEDVQPWSPPVFHHPKPRISLEELHKLRLAAVGRVPRDSFFCLFNSTSNVSKHLQMAIRAHSVISRFRVELELAFQGRQELRAEALDLTLIVGMGPGLTPSGDDFIGGIMMGLCAVGYEAVAAKIWRCVEVGLKNRSNLISIAHLEAAASGMAASKLHDIANALCLGEVVNNEMLSGIGSIGHTSGWDALAGMITVFEVLALSCRAGCGA